LTEVDSFF